MSRLRPARWNAVARTLHWAVAAGVAWQLATGWASQGLADRDAGDETLRLHVRAGVLLAALVVVRLLWRLGTTPPDPAPDPRPWRGRAASAVHTGLYVLMLLLPASGFIVWDYFDHRLAVLGAPLPDLVTPTEDERLRAGAWYVHVWAGQCLAALLCLHIGAALWHALVLRDGLLKRMT